MKKKEVINLVDQFHEDYQDEMSSSKSFNKGVNYAVKKIKEKISGKSDEKPSAKKEIKGKILKSYVKELRDIRENFKELMEFKSEDSIDLINDIKKTLGLDKSPSTIIAGIDVDNLDPSKVYYVEVLGEYDPYEWIVKKESIIRNCEGFLYSLDRGILNKTGVLCNLEDIHTIREATKQERQIVWKKHPELIPRDQPFTDWWEGQEVWSVIRGKGIIERISFDQYTLVFKKEHGEYIYTEKGCYHLMDKFPDLYPYPVKVVEDKSKTNE